MARNIALFLFVFTFTSMVSVVVYCLPSYWFVIDSSHQYLPVYRFWFIDIGAERVRTRYISKIDFHRNGNSVSPFRSVFIPRIYPSSHPRTERHTAPKIFTEIYRPVQNGSPTKPQDFQSPWSNFKTVNLGKKKS